MLISSKKEFIALFEGCLKDISRNEEIKAYLIGIFTEYLTTSRGFEKESLVLAYSNAISVSKFESFQQIGDWVLWTGIIAPELFDKHKSIYQSIGQRSYYSCHNMLRRQWKLYEELADDLPIIVDEIRKTTTIFSLR